METSNRQKLLMIVAGAAAALLIGDNLIFTPLVKSWKERSERITALKKSIYDGDQMIKRQASLHAHWQKISTNTLPNSVSVAEGVLLNAFDRWARESHVAVGSIRPQLKETDEDYTTLECRADASGSIESLSRFLYEIEKDPLAIKVQDIEITSRDDSGNQLAVALQLSGLLLTPKTQ